MGRLQRYVSDVKADINREIELEELRKMRDSMQKAASDMQSSFDSQLNKTADELNKAVEGAKPEAPAARPGSSTTGIPPAARTRPR